MKKLTTQNLMERENSIVENWYLRWPQKSIKKTFPFLNEFMTWEEVERKMFSSLLDGVQHSFIV